MAKPVPQEIPDEAELTQWGEWRSDGQNFRSEPRPEIGENDMSLILGRVDARSASMLVTRSFQPLGIARHTTAGILRSNNFDVEHTPRRDYILHVSVFPPREGDHERAVWDNDMAKRFDSCFTDNQGR